MLCYTLQNNLRGSCISNLFKPGYAVTHCNGFKLAKLSSNLDINKYCYHNRVVDILNSLQFDVVTLQWICTFKGRLRPVNFDQCLIIV